MSPLDFPATPDLDLPEPPGLPDEDRDELDDEPDFVVPKTGLVRLTPERYFADPCATPSLSSSIANVIDSESPLHAWSRHPRFGGVKRAPTKAFDRGSLSHALLLGSGKDVSIIEADDYKTKAAQADRDEAREAGLVPVLAADYEDAKRTAEKLRQRFAELGIVLDGQSELTALWTERARNGGEVQCRGMIDHLKPPTIYDLKSIRSAKHDMCRKHIETYGYAIQGAAYERAIERIYPALTGRVRFVFVFFELEPPYAVTPIRLSGSFRHIGSRAWQRSVDAWEECLRTGSWPGYADEIVTLEPSPWALSRDEEKEQEARR